MHRGKSAEPIVNQIRADWHHERRRPDMGGIFAQSSMGSNAVHMYTRALKASENVHDISYVLHCETPGGAQRSDVSISQKN